MKSCWYFKRSPHFSDFWTWKTKCGFKIFIDWSYSLILLITLLISCVSPMHRKNINHMKHYVVMKEVHRLAPALASLLRRRKNRNFCTQWVQAVQCTAALFCTYYSGPVCAIPYFATRFIQSYVKFCFATFETTFLAALKFNSISTTWSRETKSSSTIQNFSCFCIRLLRILFLFFFCKIMTTEFFKIPLFSLPEFSNLT